MNSDQNSPANTIRQISLHQAPLLAYILALHPNRSDAQDILQETNVVLWQKIGEFREGTNFKAWAFRVAYLQTLAHFKRHKRGNWLGFSSELVETLASEAVGFVIETPDGYAIDYGTRFAVHVDRAARRSDFELIEGEIAVHHSGTGKEVRLQEPHKTVSVHEGSVNLIDLEQQTSALDPTSDVTRIGTNGRATSVLRNNKRHKFLDPEVLSVKKTDNGKWDHRSFFAFDLSTVDAGRLTAARLRLNLVPSQRGFASRLPELNRFGVYGLTNPAKADWTTEATWEDSPAPEDGILLGTFEIPRSQQRGSFGIANQELAEFLQTFPGQSVTLILVRETTQVEGEVPGLTHMFASDAHPEAVGPLLELSFE